MSNPGVSRQIAAIDAGRGGNDAAGRPVPPQGPHWDLNLLTPDDVCALLKVKKSWSVIQNPLLGRLSGTAQHLGKFRDTPHAVIKSNGPPGRI